jgi:hypothetical protein
VILGIDASRTRIAAALLDADENIVATEIQKMPSTEDERERMDAVHEFLSWLGRVADDGGGAIMGVFIEGAYAGPNIKTSMQQAQFIGVVQALAWRKWPHALSETIGNAEWRKRAGVVMQPGLPYSRPKRQDIKDATRAWAISRFAGYDIEALTEDEIDSLGVAVAGWGIVE